MCFFLSVFRKHLFKFKLKSLKFPVKRRTIYKLRNFVIFKMLSQFLILRILEFWFKFGSNLSTEKQTFMPVGLIFFFFVNFYFHSNIIFYQRNICGFSMLDLFIVLVTTPPVMNSPWFCFYKTNEKFSIQTRGKQKSFDFLRQIIFF